MLKKNKSKNLFLEDDDVIVIDKKTKRRLERQRAREEQQRQAAEEEASAAAAAEASVQEDEPADDAMSQIARLCQENNWRQAVLTCRAAIQECSREGKEDMVMPLTFALAKLEMSLRRQMASAFIANAREMLKKEYLLDVGEE
jgi:hypothetical protein